MSLTRNASISRFNRIIQSPSDYSGTWHLKPESGLSDGVPPCGMQAGVLGLATQTPHPSKGQESR
ncbi:MAG: hypothetical protein JXA03_05080 [Bacteroidales bacterium]|nr:hypothetical protein [Bacteroidales bacterium]